MSHPYGLPRAINHASYISFHEDSGLVFAWFKGREVYVFHTDGTRAQPITLDMNTTSEDEAKHVIQAYLKDHEDD